MPNEIHLNDRIVKVAGQQYILREYHESHLDLIRLQWFALGFMIGIIPPLVLIYLLIG